MMHRGILASGLTTRRLAICALSALSIGATFSPADAGISFKDVSVEAGFDTHLYQSPSKHSLGVNWIDVNEDGWSDLFVVDGFNGTPHLYINEQDGTFSDGNAYLPVLPNYDHTGSIFADYDNDGDSDIYIYTDNEQWDLNGFNLPDGPPNLLLKSLWVENGGVLMPGVPLYEEVAVAAGVDDLADEPLGTYTGYRTKAATWVDYDRDGCVDLYVGHMVFQADGDASNRDRMYRNQCDGTFEDVTADLGLYETMGEESNEYRPTLAVVAGHFDNDLWPDLYVAHASPGVEGLHLPEGHFDRIFKNNMGVYKEVFFEGVGDDAQAAMGVDFADIDRDGDWDFYLADMIAHAQELEVGLSGNPLYLNVGGNALTENVSDLAGVQGIDSWGVNFFDADQDGHEDLFVATFGAGAGLSYMFRNALDGTFEDLSAEAGFTTDQARGSACADYDNDGDVDVAVVNQDGILQLFKNESTEVGNWIQFELHGTSSNADAIGALVSIGSAVEETEIQLRQVKGGSSAHSQDSFIVHAGVGTEEVVNVKIEWPSGAVHTASSLAVNQRHVIIENEGKGN